MAFVKTSSNNNNLHYNPLIIEFVGLGGVGKSTLKDNITELMRAEGLEARNIPTDKDATLKYKIFITALNTLFALYILFKYRVGRDRKKLMYFLKDRLRTYQKIKSTNGPVTYILDEGIMQFALVSCYFRNNNINVHNLISDLFRYVRIKPQLVVFTKTDPHIIRSRRILRNKKSEITDLDQIKIENKKFQKILNQIEFLFDRHNLNYLITDNSDYKGANNNDKLIFDEIIKITKNKLPGNKSTVIPKSGTPFF